LTLRALGWHSYFASEFEPYEREGFIAGRVAVQHRGEYVLLTEAGEMRAEAAGNLLHSAAPPAVGDWVAARPFEAGKALVHAVLPRRTAFTRKAAAGPTNRTEEQVLAANVDTVFLVSSFGPELKVRRIERYLASAWESGADPVIVLTKLDAVSIDEVASATAEVEAVCLGVPIHAVSAVTGDGVENLAQYLIEGRTVALLGSSGVGKSTLVNYLAGREILSTGELRPDGRGRHTTSHRELVPLPGGALVLDTPGLRELQLWEAEAGLEQTFEDIASLFSGCRFSDCKHETEPGCAVQAALAAGTLSPERWTSYTKLQREQRELASRHDARLASNERKSGARLSARGREPGTDRRGGSDPRGS